jgi:hypothetical protein
MGEYVLGKILVFTDGHIFGHISLAFAAIQCIFCDHDHETSVPSRLDPI